MNWFTTRIVDSVTDEKKLKIFNSEYNGGNCEHVEADYKLMYAVSAENDSFGREEYCSCKACHEAAKAREDESPVTCHDCGKEFPKKETREWKWYDFYAPQGDEPLVVCDTCAKAEKHVARKIQDKADYEEELGYNDRVCD